MSSIVSKKLSIDKNNIEQYCDANNVSFNVADHAWRKWLNGSTDGYVILKTEGKSVIYPTDTAKPIKADSLISASRSAGTCIVDLQFAGTKIHEESYTSGSQKQKSKLDITDTAVTNSTKATEIKWHVYGKNGDNLRGDLIELTLYFNQYTMSANIGTGARGVKSVSSSSSVAYDGDTITFSAELYNGAVWDGWYSDADCMNLVSSEQNYSVSPNADITLYAKATIDKALYACAAIAGTEIANATVSDPIVVDGDACTFTAAPNIGCTFDGWYSDSDYSTLVSTSNPYTTTITADTTLYARAHKNELHISVGAVEHGTATVSAATVTYGNDVTFTFTPEDETWELYGWYSDSALTQLVSEANPYTFTVTEDVMLYPRVGKKRYTITLSTSMQFSNSIHTLLSCDLNSLTSDELIALKRGNLEAIGQNKIFDKQTFTSHWLQSKAISIKCPMGYAIGMSASNSNDNVTICFSLDDIALTFWPYYMTIPTGNQNYQTIRHLGTCLCSAEGLDGISSAYVPSHVAQGKKAPFEAEVKPGYVFQGWYDGNEALIDSNNPANIVTPVNDAETNNTTSLTLYAKATKATYTIGVGTTEHCTTSVSSATAQYGDSVTFSCVVDEGYEFKGWYSDEGLTQLVSESAEYVHSVTGNITLWAKVSIKTYVITFGLFDWTETYPINFEGIAVYYDRLTRDEIECLRTGMYDGIDSSKIIERKLAKGDVAQGEIFSTINCPIDAYIALYAHTVFPSTDTSKYGRIADQNFHIIANWPYYWCKPTENMTFYCGYALSDKFCICTATAKDGIDYAYATTPTYIGEEAIFTAELLPDCIFQGWYFDEACMELASSDNPARITIPSHTSSLTLYAKAISTTASATGIYLKQNNLWTEAKSAYKKVDGTWVADINYSKTILSQKDRIGTFVYIV